MSKKKKTKLSKFEDTYMAVRKDWSVKPVTKVIPNKKKNYQFKEESINMDDFLMYETAEEYYNSYRDEDELLFHNSMKKKNIQYDYDSLDSYYFNNNDDNDIDMYKY